MKNDIRKDVARNPENATKLDKMIELRTDGGETEDQVQFLQLYIDGERREGPAMVEGLIKEIDTKD